MVMYIFSKTSREPIAHAYVGQDIIGDKPQGLGVSPYDVREIYVDGHELLRCMELMRRPDIKTRSCTFYGENAQFIVGNWKK